MYVWVDVYSARSHVWASRWQRLYDNQNLEQTLTFDRGRYWVNFTFAFWNDSDWTLGSEWSTGNRQYGWYGTQRSGQPTGFGEDWCDL